MDFFASIFSTGPVLFNLFLLLGLALIYKYTKKDARISMYLDKIPGPKSYPVIGSLMTFVHVLQDFIPHALLLPAKYGRLVKLWAGNKPYVLILGPEDIEIVLSNPKYIEKGNSYDFLESWVGQGVATAKGDDWKPRRKLLNHTFHTKILEKFTEVFNKQGNVLVGRIKLWDDSPGNLGYFDICPYLLPCTMDIICETVMGKELNFQMENTESEYCKALNGMLELLGERMISPWLEIPLIERLTGKDAMKKKYVKILHEFTEKVIRERRREIITEPETMGKKPFLDMLLDLAKDGVISDTAIREEVDTFMFAGHDTVFASLSWAVLLLGNHPECQKRIQEELKTIFGDDIHRDITITDVSKMKYLECCIKEIQRLIPVTPFFARKLAQDVTLSNGVIVPAGVILTFSPMLTQRDPELFPNPGTFNPDRFLPENSIGRHPYSHIPFSAGPRNCIGQTFALLEAKVLLSKIFMNYNIVAATKFEDIALVPRIILQPVDGVLVKITSRNK